MTLVTASCDGRHVCGPDANVLVLMALLGVVG